MPRCPRRGPIKRHYKKTHPDREMPIAQKPYGETAYPFLIKFEIRSSKSETISNQSRNSNDRNGAPRRKLEHLLSRMNTNEVASSPRNSSVEFLLASISAD